MELKAKIEYTTNKERLDFIVENNHKKGYEIVETENTIEAWGKGTEELLQDAKNKKTAEALQKAYEYENKTGFIKFNCRPTDGENLQTLSVELFNQSKFFQLLIGFIQGLIKDDFVFSTKEDVNVYINQHEAQLIYTDITNALSKLWIEDYINYKSRINKAETVEEVEDIVINYGSVTEEIKNVSEVIEE